MSKRHCDDHDILPATGMECYECLLSDRNALRALLAERDERIEAAVECLQKIQNDKLTIQQIWGLAMAAEYDLTLNLPAPPPAVPVTPEQKEGA